MPRKPTIDDRQNRREVIMRSMHARLASSGSRFSLQTSKKYVVDPKMEKKISTAVEYYLNYSPGLSNAQIVSELNGIDFSREVEVVELQPGYQLSQYQTSGSGVGEIRQGNYYADLLGDVSGVDYLASFRGISSITVKDDAPVASRRAAQSEHYKGSEHLSKYYVSEKQETIFITTNPIKTLKTMTMPIVDSWSIKDSSGRGVPIKTKGGFYQYYVGTTKNSSIKPMLHYNWQNAVEKFIDSPKKVENPPPKAENEALHAEYTKYLNDLYLYTGVLYEKAKFDINNEDKLNELIDNYIHVHSLAIDKYGDADKIPEEINDYLHIVEVAITKVCVHQDISKKRHQSQKDALAKQMLSNKAPLPAIAIKYAKITKQKISDREKTFSGYKPLPTHK